MAAKTEAPAQDPARTWSGGTHIFRSRIARRILLLFVLAALLPLLLFAGLSLREVTHQLQDQAEDRLHGSCKAIGMAIVERLHLLRADLVLLQESVAGEDPGALTEMLESSERLVTRFAWLAQASPEGAWLDRTDEAASLPKLTTEEREHLAGGNAALLFRGSSSSERVSTLMAHQGSSDGTVLVGRIHPEYLWAGEWIEHSSMDIVTLTPEGAEPLFSTRRGAQLAASVREAAAESPASGGFDWESADDSHLAAYRTMFTAPMFHNNFLIALSHPLHYVLAPIETFKTLFLRFGLLTLLTIVVASLVQIRRSLSPIVVLHQGTQRLADLSSDEAVVIRSGDEFEELADSFNSMAASIRRRTDDLKRANQAKSDFLAHMSHELRTPLTAVLGYSELALLPEASDEERRRSLSVIQDNGQHLLQTVDKVLNMSRAEAGELQAKITDCNPRRIVEASYELLEGLAREKELTMELKLAQQVPALIRTDAEQLRQILVNVIGNAVQYTQAGRVDVSASWSPIAPGRGTLLVRVRDTGPGIPQEELEEIFEPFYQLDLSMSRSHGGTGLGLSLSRAIARRLGGDVVCRSKPGTGSEFDILVEAECLEDVAPATPSRAPAPAGTPTDRTNTDEDTLANAGTPSTSELSCSRVLIAEDVPVNRKMVTMMLERSGIAFDEAEDGVVALEKGMRSLRAGEPYAVIFMDMQMPRMDGYEATRRLRESGYTGPIIALTAHSLDGERERCLESGCDDYETKPINKDRLVAAVLRHTTNEASA